MGGASYRHSCQATYDLRVKEGLAKAAKFLQDANIRLVRAECSILLKLMRV